MNLIPARWRREKTPLSDEQATDGPECQRPHERLTAPRGRVAWVCATPTGRVGCVHDTEAQAKWHGKTVWWPVLIDENEELATGEAS